MEICEYLKVSEATVMNMIFHKKMPAQKKEGIWVSTINDIDKWQITKYSKNKSTKKNVGKSTPKDGPKRKNQ